MGGDDCRGDNDARIVELRSVNRRERRRVGVKGSPGGPRVRKRSRLPAPNNWRTAALTSAIPSRVVDASGEFGNEALTRPRFNDNARPPPAPPLGRAMEKLR